MKQQSTVVSKRADPRPTRTRRRIDDAFVLLLQRRSYDGIRVRDITRKAGVGRATFYAHHQSKPDLLRSQMVRLVLPLLREQPASPALFDCTELFEHISHAKSVYRSLMKGPSRLATENILRGCLEQRFQSALSPHHGADIRAIAARFAVSTLTALVIQWVESDFRDSSARMAAIYQALVGGGLKKLIVAATPEA